MSELKPCPFCGKEMTTAPTFGDTFYKLNTHEEPGVYCPNCGAIGPNDVSYERADEMWNLRRPEDALRARIAELEAATRWIPVEERLPEKNYNDIGDEIIVVLGYPYNRPVAMKFCDGEFYSGGFGRPSTDWTDKVTHWMPLPQPPAVQE